MLCMARKINNNSLVPTQWWPMVGEFGVLHHLEFFKEERLFHRGEEYTDSQCTQLLLDRHRPIDGDGTRRACRDGRHGRRDTASAVLAAAILASSVLTPGILASGIEILAPWDRQARRIWLGDDFMHVVGPRLVCGWVCLVLKLVTGRESAASIAMGRNGGKF